MKIIVAFLTDDLSLAAISVSPNWLEWLLGVRRFDDIARDAGDGSWVWDSPFGGPITHDGIVNAIDAACSSERACRALRKRISELQRGAYP